MNFPIVFSSSRSGRYAIYKINVDGTGLKKIIGFESVKRDCKNPVLSPNKKIIAFEVSFPRKQPGFYPPRNIYRINIDGTELFNITENFEYISKRYADNYGPLFSPDSNNILFKSTVDRFLGGKFIGSHHTPNSHLWMISINGRKERKLTKYENIASASLSRKGFRLAYLRSWVMGTDDIFLIPNYMKMVSLKQKISVTLNHMYHSHPIFSSDGETIFYTESDAILTPASVLSKHIPTSKVTIINKSGQSEDICAISDDDTKLLMTQYYFLSKSTESDLFIIDIKNKKEHKLTENSRSNYSGIFTANDEKIIFVSNRSGQEELYMININGTNEKRLTSIGACNPCA